MPGMSAPIYLDHNATTPLADEVLEAMTAALRDLWGNPSSVHGPGRAARGAIERARGEVAELLECAPEEIVFTGGGTESDNLAIAGVAAARERLGRHVVISAVEHPAVEEPCRRLEALGWEVSRIGVKPDGRVDLDALGAALRSDTVLVSVMHAHNETGVVQPVAAVASAARERGIPVHTDACQTVGKICVAVDDLGVDLLSLAGHKLYGPKGVGALYVRGGLRIEPVVRGAGHERGIRPGTEPTPEIVGLGAACTLARRELPERVRRQAELRDRLERGLRRELPGLVVHGERAPRLPNTALVALPGVDAVALVEGLDEVAMSTGSACHAGGAPAGVLAAMGVAQSMARGTVRLTLGRRTTEAEVDRAVAAIARGASAYRIG